MRIYLILFIVIYVYEFSIYSCTKQFESRITISKDGKTGDCKKVFTIMSLAVKNGQEVTISVEGADEEAAAQKIKEFFEENM